MINIGWTILVQRDYIMENSLPYLRMQTDGAFDVSKDPTMLNTLIPYTETRMRALYADQLLQRILRSPLRSRLLALDPRNTYEATRLIFPTPGVVTTELPAGVTLSVTNLPAAFTHLQTGGVMLRCSVDPVLQEFTVLSGLSEPATLSFTVAGNLTSPIEVLPDVDIRLKGPLGVLPFEFITDWTFQMFVDWTGLLNRCRNSNWQWVDDELKETALYDSTWPTQIAAYALNAIEYSHASS